MLNDYLEEIKTRYNHFLSCYHLSDNIKKSRSIDTWWKKIVDENIEIINNYYGSIFEPVEKWMMDLAIIELYKLFDNSNDCYTLHEIIKHIRNEKIQLEEELGFVLDIDLIDEIDEKLKRAGQKIESLRNARNNRGHNFKQEKINDLTHGDVDELSGLVGEISQLLSWKLQSIIIINDWLILNIKNDVEGLFAVLRESYNE